MEENIKKQISDQQLYFWCSREIESLPLILAEKIMQSAKNSSPPSEVLMHTISTFKVSDDWSKFSFSENTMVFKNMIKITSGEHSKLENSLRLLEDLKRIYL